MMFETLNVTYVVVVIVTILIAMTVHEYMHAFVSFKLGDTTALDNGRLTLNPFKHIDPVMSVLLPVITLLFFHAPILAAKPVPFNPSRLKYDEFGAAMVAAAGPLSNLALAFIAALIVRSMTPSSYFTQVLDLFTQLNVALFVFNMIPLPPLDGSRVLYSIAPQSLRNFMDQIEPYGLYIIFGLVILGGFGGVLGGLNSFVLNLLP